MDERVQTPTAPSRRHSATNQVAFVRADVIRNSFPSAVKALGGKAEQLMTSEGIRPELIQQADGVLPYRSMISLLERTAQELGVPDFGLLLARHTPDSTKTLGPLEIAMKNSETLRDAFNYCARYHHVYSSAIHMSLERSDWDGREYMLFDIVLDGVPQMRQVVEHALALTHNSVKIISNRRAQATEIWFAHGEPASTASHHQYFGIPVKFNMPFNAIFFGKEDLARPIENRNPMVFRMAANFIDQYFPASEVPLMRQVRVVVAKLLPIGRINQATVADMMGTHPRTLQRRLRAEGTTFEEIVDVVRREIALRNLADRSVSLTQIAEKLGYSETSVLTRSCQRWFSQSPIQMRKSANGARIH